MIFAFDNYVLDTGRRELRRGHTVVSVQPQVFDLLEYLIRNRDHVVGRDDLLDAIWGGRIVSESTLATRINAARSAIGDDGESQRLIRTLPRKGIRFVGEVREVEEEGQPKYEKWANYDSYLPLNIERARPPRHRVPPRLSRQGSRPNAAT